MNAQKLRGREGIVSTRFVFLFFLVLILLSSSLAQALEDWDIYSDADIIDGQYNLINIYDTPPDNTTVNMYGGSADFISTFDLSTLNIHGGNADVGAFENSVINISGGNIEHATALGYGTVNFFGSEYTDSLRIMDFGIVNMESGIVERISIDNSSIANLYGGTISDYITSYDSSTINIYGYDLIKNNSGGSYGDGQVSGFWMDGISFRIDLRGQETFGNVFLIPEPCSMILLAFGSLILTRKK